MDTNIPEQVRGWLYIFCGLGSVVVTYLAAAHIIGLNEVAAWTGFTAFIAALARFNLSTPTKEN